MRVNKFRAFLKEAKAIKPVNDLTFNSLEDEPVGVNGCGNEDCPTCVDWYKLEDVILMRCTGLKGFMSDKFQDHEEKEVYQGDHVTIFQESLPGGFYLEEYITGVVDLDETGTAFIIKNAKIESNVDDIPRSIDDIELSVGVPSEEDLKEVFLHDFDLTSDDITINGNIYENPELLGA